MGRLRLPRLIGRGAGGTRRRIVEQVVQLVEQVVHIVVGHTGKADAWAVVEVHQFFGAEFFLTSKARCDWTYPDKS